MLQELALLLLQVKMPITLDPTEGPNQYGTEVIPFCCTEQNRYFHLKIGAKPAPKSQWLHF
jgi:hypothetical protein